MTAAQLCDGCLTRWNALRPTLRSCGHHWLDMKIDNGPISLFIIASLCLRGFSSHVRTPMFKVTGLLVVKWTSHMRQEVMIDVANIQSDPIPSKCTGVLRLVTLYELREDNFSKSGASNYSYTVTQNHRLFFLFSNSHQPADSHQWNVRKSPDRLSPVSSSISFFPKQLTALSVQACLFCCSFPLRFRRRTTISQQIFLLKSVPFFGHHFCEK